MPDFSEALESAREELSRLRRDRQLLDVEIAKMENVIAALSAVTAQDEEAMQTSGLTDAIRSVLRMAPEGLSPTEVRSRLEASGFNFSTRYTNLMANIHIVLRRLEQSGEATVITTENASGKRYYWTMNAPSFRSMSIGELLAMSRRETVEPLNPESKNVLQKIGETAKRPATGTRDALIKELGKDKK
jgi:hypothetical protein